MQKKQWVVDLVAGMTSDKLKAEQIVDRLMEEGVLTLGYGNADVDKVVRVFVDTFGTTKVSRTDRFATSRMVKKYGPDMVIGIITLLASKNGERFSPVVGSLTQLEAKWVNVINFLKNERVPEVIEL